MRPEQILLHTPRNGNSVYQFTCPACLDPVEKPADRRAVALLVSAGVDLATEESLLGEPPVDEPLDVVPMDPMETLPTGPPLTLDDLLDFHFLLLDDAYIEQCLAAIAPGGDPSR